MQRRALQVQNGRAKSARAAAAGMGAGVTDQLLSGGCCGQGAEVNGKQSPWPKRDASDAEFSDPDVAQTIEDRCESQSSSSTSGSSSSQGSRSPRSQRSVRSASPTASLASRCHSRSALQRVASRQQLGQSRDASLDGTAENVSSYSGGSSGSSASSAAAVNLDPAAQQATHTATDAKERAERRNTKRVLGVLGSAIASGNFETFSKRARKGDRGTTNEETSGRCVRFGKAVTASIRLRHANNAVAATNAMTSPGNLKQNSKPPITPTGATKPHQNPSQHEQHPPQSDDSNRNTSPKVHNMPCSRADYAVLVKRTVKLDTHLLRVCGRRSPVVSLRTIQQRLHADKTAAPSKPTLDTLLKTSTLNRMYGTGMEGE